jgi:hypothetical protein
VWWGAAAALAACGTFRPLEQVGIDAGALWGDLGDAGAAGDGGGDGGAQLDVEGLCAGLTSTRCEALARCGLVATTDAGLTACQGYLARTWCGPTTWPSQVAVGALTLDVAMVQGCALALGSQACAEALALPAPCKALVRPAVELGQPCFDGYQECLQGVCRGATCPRSCQPLGAVGEVCSVSSDCQGSLYCRLSATTPGLGQCAAFGGEDAGCDAVTRCGSLACVGGHCQTLPGAGEPCLGGRCDAASHCVVSLDAGACQLRLDAGAACGAQDDCLAGLLCLGGACEPAQVAAGALCAPPQTCQDATLTCLGPEDAGVCAAPLAAGPCALDTDCQAQLGCLPLPDGGAECGARQPAGASCSSSRQCQLDAECSAGACAPRPLLGQACGPGVTCLEGLCGAGYAADGGGLCVPLLGPGRACTLDWQCASGRCSLGSCVTACTP